MPQKKYQKVSPRKKYKIVTQIEKAKERNNGKVPPGFVPQLAKKEGVRRTTVDKWMKKNERGESLIKPKPGQGRKRRFNEQDEMKLIKRAEEEPGISWVKLAAWFQGQGEQLRYPSERTLGRIFKRYGLFKRKPRKKPALRKKNQEKRMIWATQKKDLAEEEWKGDIYCDEKFCVSTGSTNCYIIRPKGKAYDPKFVSHVHHSGRVSIHFFGFITSQGLGEIYMFNPGPNDGNQLIRIINEAFPEMQKRTRRVRGRKVIIHDNARNFTQLLVQNHLKALIGGTNYRYSLSSSLSPFLYLSLLFSPSLFLFSSISLPLINSLSLSLSLSSFERNPPQSPDLNPIENVWSVLERRIQKKLIEYYAEGGIKNPDIFILSQMVFESWDEMKQEEGEQERRGEENLVQKLYKSLPKRAQQVFDREGMHSDY